MEQKIKINQKKIKLYLLLNIKTIKCLICIFLFLPSFVQYCSASESFYLKTKGTFSYTGPCPCYEICPAVVEPAVRSAAEIVYAITGNGINPIYNGHYLMGGECIIVAGLATHYDLPDGSSCNTIELDFFYADTDDDCILEDGDTSNTIGDNLCKSGIIENCDDNCPDTANPDQLDSDNDTLGNACDNCPYVSNLDQKDTDNDTVGDACDNCISIANQDQLNSDNDTIGDACDNCPNVSNPDLLDSDNDGQGDACDPCPNGPNDESDGDMICDDVDNCPHKFNLYQLDGDNDTLGDECDNCPDTPNPDQLDSDNDTVGDACESCVATELLSNDAPGVLYLRAFRDQVLMGNAMGRRAVGFYYEHNKKIIPYLDTHPGLKKTAKAFLNMCISKMKVVWHD